MTFKDPERGKACLRKYGKKWRRLHRAFRRKNNWRKRGMDPTEAERMYNSVNNCSICNSRVSGSNKHIDHDHNSTLPRGVLCKKCNMAIGLMREEAQLLERAIKYPSRENTGNGMRV